MTTTTAKTKQSTDFYTEQLWIAIQGGPPIYNAIEILNSYQRSKQDEPSLLPPIEDFLTQTSQTPPLVVAAYWKRYDLFKPLIQHGANPNQVALKSQAGWSGMSAFDGLVVHDNFPLEALDTLLKATGDHIIVSPQTGEVIAKTISTQGDVITSVTESYNRRSKKHAPPKPGG